MTDKRQKFVELANNRVSNAIKAIRLIGNLANRQSYEYTADDMTQIIRALNKAVSDVKDEFNAPFVERKPEFKLE